MSNKRKIRPQPTRITLDNLAEMLSRRSGLFILEHRHNPGCPTIATQDAALCTCGDDVEAHVVAPFGSREVRQ